MRAYLDDVRALPDGFDILWHTTEEAQEYCTNNSVPIFISFDHDLGYDESKGYSFKLAPTGLDFIKWLVNMDMALNGEFIPASFEFAVHSANPVGAENMNRYLTQYLSIRHKNEP
jgi:hypothetical protein